MLVLGRRRDEAIMIGDDVEIVVLGIQDGKVRLGIKAPENVEVHRREIYDRNKAREVSGDGHD